MIIQAYETVDRVVKVKITNKLVEYSDSVDYPRYVLFKKLIKHPSELSKWEERLQALNSEKEIAEEIKEDMKKFGCKLIKEISE